MAKKLQNEEGKPSMIIKTSSSYTSLLGRVVILGPYRPTQLYNGGVEMLWDIGIHMNGFDLFAQDEYLTPIRDQPGEDEMLRIAGKPVKEKHHDF